MRVPTVDTSVSLETPTVSEVRVPGAVPGAFGEDVAKATAGLGQDIAGLGKELGAYAIQQNEFKKQIKNLDLETQLDKLLTDKLTSKESETYTDSDGKEQTRLAGLINQYGRDVYGATDRFNQFAIPKMDELLAQQTDPKYRAQLGQSFGTIYNTRYNSVIAHETEQTRQADKDTIDTFLLTQNNLFPSATPENKVKIINDAHRAIQSAYDRGLYTFEQAQKKVEDFLTQVFYSSVNLNPQETINDLVAGDKGTYASLNPEDRNKLITKAELLIDKEKRLTKKLDEEKYGINYRQAVLQAIDGQLSLKSIQELYRGDLITDPQRSKLENYIYYNMPTVDEDDLTVYNQIAEMQAEGEETPEAINNLILDSATKNKLKNSSAKQLINKTYTDFKNRRDELIALNTKEMRAVVTEFFRDELDEPDKSKIETALYTFNKRVQMENANGDRITQIAQEIIIDSIRKDYPEINQIETINRVKEMFGIKPNVNEEISPPQSEIQEGSPFPEYPNAFKENGIWKVIVNGRKYRVEE